MLLQLVKKPFVIVGIVFLLFVCGLILNVIYSGATLLRLFATGTNRQITGTPIPAIALSPSSNDQREPAIDGSKVVWSEKIEKYWQIILFDAQNSSRYQLTSDAFDHVHPSISGNVVIWLQGEPGNPNRLGGINYATGQPLTLPVDQASQPYLAGSSLVWLGETNIETLATSVRFLDSETQKSETLFRSRGARWPAISGNVVVWEDWRNYNADIYGYDLLTREEFPIAVASGNQEAPNISGQIVVWCDGRNTDSLNQFGVYGYDLKTQDEFFIAQGDQAVEPKIASGFVIWGSWAGIYAYRLQDQTLLVLVAAEAAHPGSQPTISDTTVVWTQWDRPNDRYAHSQIVMGLIPTQP